MTGQPKYQTLFLTLKGRVTDGVYDWREPMPGELQLADEFKVSRATVRKAMQLLEDEGFVTRRQGAGTYAKAFGLSQEEVRRNLGMISDADGHRTVLKGEVSAQYQEVTPKRELAKQFGGDKTLGKVVRVREQEGSPYCFVVTWLPVETASQIDWAGLGDEPVISAVENCGVRFEKVEQTIASVGADEEAAEALSIAIGAPLLMVSGLFVDADDNAVMRKDGYFLPGSFEYRSTIHRR